MQRFIFKNKNNITLMSGISIVIAFISLWMFKNESVFTILLIIASIIGVIPIAIQAYQAIMVKVISIDVLVTIAVVGAFIIKNYEESAIVTFLFLFGAMLEQRTLNKTRSAIKELVDMAPEVAMKKMENGEFEETDIDFVDVGDVLLVMTGDKIPVDGVVISGEGSINEASITGESQAVIKDLDSNVFAGTILENGTLQILANKVGEDTTFGKIIELVEEAQDSKSEAERFIDKFSTYYTPIVLVISILVYFFTKDIELAITILVLGCPGALVIGVPVSNVSGIGNGARNGILLKGSEVIGDFSRTDTIIFDKTGTLTIGNPTVSEVIHYRDEYTTELGYLASVERESGHPLAKAVLDEIGETVYSDVTNTEVIKGKGIVAEIDNHQIVVGSLAAMEHQDVVIDDKVIRDAQRLEELGNSLVLLSVDGSIVSMMGIKDQLRSNVKEDLAVLRSLGVKQLIMLSGDNQGTVDVISKELGLDQAIGNMLPKDKADYVRTLKEAGHIVTFVGDGVNDSPSIALADIGIAMGSGTDVAIETSDVVLMNSDLSHLSHALGLAKKTANNMLQNIFIAVFVVLFLLASVLFSEWMNMSIGMLLHEASILVVILNGMRLLRYTLKK